MEPKLAAAVIHDLNNALGMVEGGLAQMMDGPDAGRAEDLHRTTARLRSRLAGFLTLYRAESQGLEARVEDCSPGDFLEDLVSALLPQAGSALITTRVDEGVPPVWFFDRRLVSLALEEAIRNAQREGTRHIEVSACADRGQLVFSVADDGPGPGAGSDSGSTGLGLSLCRVIAAAHRLGNCSGDAVLLPGPTGGALFRLTLP